jgi:hypothetical protein
MIFSTDNLHMQENINNTPTNNKVTITVSEKTSLFLDALKYIIEEDRLFAEELNKCNISTYSNKRKALCEKTIDVNININTPNLGFESKLKDGANGLFQKFKTTFTIENIVKFIVKAFTTIITRLWREFEIICMSIVSKNSQIKRLENRIRNVPVELKYNAPLFTYTHITDAPSETDLEDELDGLYDEINALIINLSKLKNSSIDIENAINNFNMSKYNDELTLEDIRSRLLGMNSPISEEDYAEILYKYFRNGASIASTDNILNPDDIRKRLDSWNLAPRLIKGYSRDKDKLEKAGNKLVDKLTKANTDKYLDNIPATTVDLYSDLVTRYCTRIKDTCQIFVIYYANRLDAAKEELSSNTKVLFEVAKFVTREGL